MSTLGERLFFLRKQRNLTASHVMSLIGIDNLGRYEKDERKPSVDILLSIANFYDVSCDYLLTGKKNTSHDCILSLNEQRLINLYRSSNDIGQERILEIVELINDKYNKNDTVDKT